MKSKQFLHQLLKTYQSDLKSIFPEMRGEFFVCPICLNIFQEPDIERKIITDGHVWPEYLRKRNKEARKQHVLLCNSCNNTAGSHGDKHMQMMELAKEENEKGQLKGEIYLHSLHNRNDISIKI